MPQNNLAFSEKEICTNQSCKRKEAYRSNRQKKNFFKPKPSTFTTADTSKSSKSAATTDLTFKKDDQCALDNILPQTNSTNCEIIWILKCVMSGISVRFNNDLGKTFSAMFPDINFKDFSLNRTKSMYVINHGLAPYFQTLLIEALGKSEIYVYSFAESLNDHSQTSEMDLFVRYWDHLDKFVKVRCYGSSFLGHFKANDLSKHSNELTKKLKSENLYQISMNGPNVNKKFYDDFSKSWR